MVVRRVVVLVVELNSADRGVTSGGALLLFGRKVVGTTDLLGLIFTFSISTLFNYF